MGNKNIKRRNEKMEWYAITTRNRSEKNVAFRLEKILGPDRILFPTIDGKPKYLNYLFVLADLPKELYLIKTTQGVTGFVNNLKNPIPVSINEIEEIKGVKKESAPKYPFYPGDHVILTNGPFNKFRGVITFVGKETATVIIEMFSQETKIEVPLDFLSFSKEVKTS